MTCATGRPPRRNRGARQSQPLRAGGPPWAASVIGDACDPPAELEGERFDLVYSNSVIEHVGGHAQREAFAETVRCFSPRSIPSGGARVQFLPVAARAWLTLRWPFGYRQGDDGDKALRNTLTIELLGRTEMRHYFPGCKLWEERMLGLTKSLVAIR
jgi:Methyltransferase domain